jgi:dipeptidyl aminopeptidase/acylaminoacyl peptidase
VLWFSERENWGHLYLYDLETGRLKHRVTAGEGNVAETLRIDEVNRFVFFIGVGKQSGRDPYFSHLYRAGLDGRGLTLLTPENAHHDVSFSPSGRYFVDSYSTPDTPPVAVLRAADGTLVRQLERADISRLVATGWKPPAAITVKARDRLTDLHGLLYRPTNFDASRRYPIVNRIYPGPQRGSVGSRTFAAARSDSQALAELGFIVVEIDGMGTSGRSKSFHDLSFGNIGDNTLPDQVAGMTELARRYPWIDVERTGIWGHSGGGYAAAAAMFRYPDFFKVGVAQAGNHDNRMYEDDWAEKWHGLVNGNNYDAQSNLLAATNLKGKLLLAHGTADANVPPDNTLLLVDELIKANKDFDLLLLPNRGHNFANEPYMTRRRWDYFVRHLKGVEPPREYPLQRQP